MTFSASFYHIEPLSIWALKIAPLRAPTNPMAVTINSHIKLKNFQSVLLVSVTAEGNMSEKANKVRKSEEDYIKQLQHLTAFLTFR